MGMDVRIGMSARAPRGWYIVPSRGWVCLKCEAKLTARLTTLGFILVPSSPAHLPKFVFSLYCFALQSEIQKH